MTSLIRELRLTRQRGPFVHARALRKRTADYFERLAAAAVDRGGPPCADVFRAMPTERLIDELRKNFVSRLRRCETLSPSSRIGTGARRG